MLSVSQYAGGISLLCSSSQLFLIRLVTQRSSSATQTSKTETKTKTQSSKTQTPEGLSFSGLSFSGLSLRRNWTTQQSPVTLDLCFRKTRSENSHGYLNAIVFKKLRFRNAYSPNENEKSRVSLNHSIWTALFSWQISVDGRPNHRNKTAFSN